MKCVCALLVLLPLIATAGSGSASIPADEYEVMSAVLRENFINQKIPQESDSTLSKPWAIVIMNKTSCCEGPVMHTDQNEMEDSFPILSDEDV